MVGMQSANNKFVNPNMLLVLLHPFKVVALDRERHVMIIHIAHVSTLGNISLHRAPPSRTSVFHLYIRFYSRKPVKSVSFLLPAFSFCRPTSFMSLYGSLRILYLYHARRGVPKNGHLDATRV